MKTNCSALPCSFNEFMNILADFTQYLLSTLLSSVFSCPQLPKLRIKSI
jgi:hypothetical protein